MKVKWKRVLLFAAAGLLILAILAIPVAWVGRLVSRWRQEAAFLATLPLSDKTTCVDGPLNPDGTVKYVAALNAVLSEGVTPENNALIPIIEALGPSIIDEEVREQVFEMLRMSVLPADGAYFVEFRDYVAAHAGEFDIGAQPEGLTYWCNRREEEARQKPWSPEDYPAVVAWLEANEETLAVMVAASKRSRFHMPCASTSRPPRLSEVARPDLEPIRSAARALKCRAMLSIGAGAPQRALEDSLAVHRLARLFCQDADSVTHMFAAVLEGLALEADVALAKPGVLTSEGAGAALARLRSLPTLPSPVWALYLYERWMTLEYLMLRIEGVQDMPPQGVDLMLRAANGWWDRVIAACEEESIVAMVEAFESIEADLARFHNQMRGVGLLVTAAASARKPETACRMIGTIAFSVLSVAADRMALEHAWAVQHGRLAEVALALAAYHADHGEYPQELSVLAPDFLPEIPNDRFNEEPLRYRAEGGGYVLYSVGSNLEDDGGRETKNRAEGDLVVRVQ